MSPQLPPVVLTTLPPELIHQDPYLLRNFDIQSSGDRMSMTIQFDGCTDEHSFTAYVVGGFTATNPVRANLILAHDAHGEHCSGTFERQLRFDLSPLRNEFERVHGYAGPLLVWFRDYSGILTARLYAWGDAPTDPRSSCGSTRARPRSSVRCLHQRWRSRTETSCASPGSSGPPTRTVGEGCACGPGTPEGRRPGPARGVVVTSTTWTEVTIQDTLAAAPGETLWVGLGSLRPEPYGPWGRTGCFDGFVVERLGP